MPIFEYRCADCGRVTEVLVLSRTQAVEPVCRQCGGRHLTRIPSRFRVTLSEEARLERMADLAEMGGLDESDPRSVERFLKKMGREMGEDYPGEVDEMVEEAMSEAQGENFAAGPEGLGSSGLDEE
jgi:putative FmdB family regulatory protein